MTSAYEGGCRPRVEIRHRLRIAREFAGLEQEELAERMEVTRSTISNAENGHGTPRRTTINAWALACGVAASWIHDGQEDPPPHPPEGVQPTAPNKDHGTEDYQSLTPAA